MCEINLLLLVSLDKEYEERVKVDQLSRFGKVTPPHKSVNLSCTITYIKNEWTDLCEH